MTRLGHLGQCLKIPDEMEMLPSGYDYSLPWKITMLLMGKSSISMGHRKTMAMLVITRG